MNQICDNCGKQKTIVPAGTSKKTGKAYKEFQVCNDCKPYKPQPKQENGSQSQNSPSNAILEDIQGELVVLKLQSDKILELLSELVPNGKGLSEKVEDKKEPILPF